MTFSIPPPVAKSELDDVIGEGAHSVVYRTTLKGNTVALKLSRRRAEEAGTMERLTAEATALARTDHPGVVKVYEVGEHPSGRAYLAMEFIEGETLAARLRKGKLSEAETARVGREVAEALAAVHAQDLLHRDVKPANILLPQDGSRARLIDFGLVIDHSAEELNSQTVGTFLYAAPEQTGMLKVGVDRRSDLYALGAVLYECLTGKPPFDSNDAAELIRLHGTQHAPQVRSKVPIVSESMDALVQRLLQKDPDDRYRDTAALASDLAAAEQGELLADKLSAHLTPPADPAPPLEREKIMGQLMTRVESAKRGRGSLALITGGTGLGKSRVVRAVARRVGALGGITLSCELNAAASTPLSLFKQLVRGLLDHPMTLPESERAGFRLKVREAAADYAPFLAEVLPETRPVLGIAEDAPATQAGQQIYEDAVAHLFTELGTEQAPCLICIEGPQHADDNSQRTLKRMLEQVRGTHTLVIATTAELPESGNIAGVEPKVVLELEPLTPAGVAKLAAVQLGTKAVDPELADQLVSRTAGNPLSVMEHIRAMLEHGALTPVWGKWQLHRHRLAEMSLPDSVDGLMLARARDLDDESRDILARASLLGDAFPADTLAQLWEDRSAVYRTLSSALQLGVLELQNDGRYAFLHEPLREFLAEVLSPEERPAVHLAAAKLLSPQVDQDSGKLYACARHFAAGVTAECAQRACDVNVQAGCHALGEHAPKEAIAFLNEGRRIAEKFNLKQTDDLLRSLADAYAVDGDVDGCLDVTPLAVDACPDVLRKVHLLRRAADLFLMYRADTGSAHTALLKAYRLLGARFPGKGWRILWRIPFDMLRAAYHEWRWKARPNRPIGDKERRAQALTQLMEITNRWAVFEGQFSTLIGTAYAVFIMGLKSGPSREQTWAFSTHEIIHTFFMKPEAKGARYYRLALQQAKESGDRGTEARVHMLHGAVLCMRGHLVKGAAALEHVVNKHSPWLEPGDLMLLFGQLANNYAARGYTARAASTLRKCLERVEGSGAGGLEEAKTLDASIEALETIYERPAIAAERALNAVREAQGPEKLGPWLLAWGRRISSLLETDDLAPIDDAIDQGERAGGNAFNLSLQSTDYWVIRARARMEQAILANDKQRERRLEQLRKARAALRMMGNNPVLLTWGAIFEAAEMWLADDRRGALTKLGKAEVLALEHDIPEGMFQAQYLKARILLRAGLEEPAVRCLLAARQIANELGWPIREQRLRLLLNNAASFAKESSVGDYVTRTVTHTVVEGSGSVDAFRVRRERDALIDVTLAAATEFDPARQARAALDRLVRNLSAERAFLFLWDDRERELQLLAARDTDGQDLTIDRLPWSLINKVRENRAPLVVNGSEEGARLGFESVRTHNIRSMICAPLLLREQFTGVIYMDSTIAKGVFNDADLDVLRAIANQIAISQETAKSARREIAHRELEKDMEVTGAVQSLLLPKKDTFNTDQLRMCTHYEPLSRAGGDFWFMGQLPDGRLRVLVADATGHGAGAAMVTAALAGCQRALHNGKTGTLPGGDLMEELYRVLRETCQGTYTVPAGLVEVAPDGSVECWSAASPPMLVHSPDTGIKVHSMQGYALGDEAMRIGHASFKLEPGDRLLVFTDGIFELELPNGRELGTRRLGQFLSSCADLDLLESRDALREKVREAQGGSEAEDDITYVMIERRADVDAS